MAVANYESEHGHLPARITPNGHHSWRTYVLPYLEHEGLSERIRFDVPWDAPANIQFHASIPHDLQCHNRDDGTGNTQIFAVTAPNSIWQDRKLRTNEIPDGPYTTLLLIELDLPSINWMAPSDVALKDLLAIIDRGERLPSLHPDGILMVFADMHVEVVPHHQITRAYLEAIISIDGDEQITNPWSANDSHN